MKVSGFTITRNARRYHYPLLSSIYSILPICDEFIVNVGDSDDGTLELVRSINSPKVRIIQNKWDFSQGKEVLSYQTNLALRECSGHWAFYLQNDEVIHEEDLGHLKKLMVRFADDESVEALRFSWLHFFGSCYRYRVDGGWYQKQDRIIKNNGRIHSVGDAYGFARTDGRSLKRFHTGRLLYHYGWVQPPEIMSQRRVNAEKIGFITRTDRERAERYDFGDLDRFPVYFGTHPKVMDEYIAGHALSQEDYRYIQRRYCWHPFRIWKVRFKTPQRIKEKID